jgi:CheY-like chemotaxis protein
VQDARKKILYVDDEEIMLKPFGQILSSLGYDVVSMRSSTEALAAFSKEPAGFDLVLTDHAMPELTGYDLAGRILKIRPDIPIILYTGYSADISPEQVRQSGIRAFLMKPISGKELAGVISRVLDPLGCEAV